MCVDKPCSTNIDERVGRSGMDGEDWVGDRWSGDDFGVYRYVTEKAEMKIMETQDEAQRTRHFRAYSQDIMDWSRSTVFRHLIPQVHRAIGFRRYGGWVRVARTTWRSSAHGSDLCLRRCTWTWRGEVRNGVRQRRRR